MQYDGFSDLMASAQKKGVFVICLGRSQPSRRGAKWLARFWIDAVSFKELTKGFQDQLKSYEKKYGAIKT